MLNYALNHMTVARTRYDKMLSLADELGCVGVEFRNDLAGPLFDDDAPETVRQAAADKGLRILGLSEVKMFNAWDEQKAKETEALLQVARALGAETVSLIPRCDGLGCGNGERQANLRIALREILPMLEDHDMKALIEPLGFAHSSLRLKSEAVAAITALGGDARLRLVHDTFHHYLADEREQFPELTGIVHISGVEDTSLIREQIGDEHRVLVREADYLGNIQQLRDLIRAGYTGPLSFEAFSPEIHNLADPECSLRASMDHITNALAVTEAA